MQRKNTHLGHICTALVLSVACTLLLTACDSKGTPKNSTPIESDNPNAASYTVTLDPNGGSFTSGNAESITLQVKEGTAIDFPANMPTYEGNTLYGWYQTDGSPWPGARKVSSDLALKAKWSVTEEVEVYPLVLTIGDTQVVMERDNGVYQFTHVSAIYGGYAQRSGKYTLYEDHLKAAIEADDGTVQRVLLKADSNYIDATGTIYAEFYNDGEFELYYDFTNNGERSKYCMNTGFWTYEGYTPPFENTPIPVDETGMGYTSAHVDWDASLLGEEAIEGEGKDKPAEAETVTVPGAVIYTADAAASETMKANFCDNGVLAIFMTSYGVNVDAKYLWSNSEESGFSITYNGGEGNLAVPSEEKGVYTFPDNNGNTYTVSLPELIAAIHTPEQIYTAPATVSTTMSAFFYDNHTLSIMFDLTAYGQTGQFSPQGSGQWNYTEEGGLTLAIDGKALELTEVGDTLQFTLGENTYAVTLSELISGIS